MWLGVLAAAFMLGVALRVDRVGRRIPRFPTRPLTGVVLGARVHADGSPSPALIDRVRVGVALLNEGRAQRLILSGGSPDDRPTEASVMQRLALEFGAPAESLVLETKSRSTFENAAFTVPLLGDEREIILVSCDFHLARATAHFRRRGLTVWPVPSPRALATGARLIVTFKELIALVRRPWLIAKI